MSRWHSRSLILWWWWRWAVRSASWTRVVLGTSPREAHARVSNWISLHLVDGHLCGVALNELDETTALSWWDLNVGDLSKALEEAAELILGDVAGKTADEDSGVVRIRKLVHWLRSAVVTNGLWSGHAEHAWGHAATSHTATWHATHGTGWSTASRLVLWSGSRNAHWAVTAVDTLHLSESALLIALIREANEAVATGHAGDWVGHDLGRLAGWEPALEEGDQNILVDLWSEITNEDGELWATVIATVGKSTTGSPVELEWARGVWNHRTVEREGLGGSLWGGEVDEAVAGVARELVADHLDVDLLAHAEPDTADKVLVNPWLKLTHPKINVSTT